jgi:hypothetical protein
LREAQQAEADARLEALLLEGLASGDPIPIDEEYWKSLDRRMMQYNRKYSVQKKMP